MKQEDRLFILGLISLVFSFFLLPFALYLFPAVWLGWEYRVPDFVVNGSLWLQVMFHTSYAKGFLWFFRFTFLLAVFFGVVAYLISKHISKLQAEVDGEAADEISQSLSSRAKREGSDALGFIFKLAFIIMLVFIGAYMIQWAISLTQTPIG